MQVMIRLPLSVMFLVKGGEKIFLRKRSKVLGKAGKERFSTAGNEHYAKFVRCVTFNSSNLPVSIIHLCHIFLSSLAKFLGQGRFFCVENKLSYLA